MISFSGKKALDEVKALFNLIDSTEKVTSNIPANDLLHSYWSETGLIGKSQNQANAEKFTKVIWPILNPSTRIHFHNQESNMILFLTDKEMIKKIEEVNSEEIAA